MIVSSRRLSETTLLDRAWRWVQDLTSLISCHWQSHAECVGEIAEWKWNALKRRGRSADVSLFHTHIKVVFWLSKPLRSKECEDVYRQSRATSHQGWAGRGQVLREWEKCEINTSKERKSCMRTWTYVCFTCYTHMKHETHTHILFHGEIPDMILTEYFIPSFYKSGNHKVSKHSFIDIYLA